MHSFGIFGGVLHATALLVLAFFILFAASRAEGWLRTFGRVLGAWLVILALAGIVMALVAPRMGWAGHHMRGYPGAEPALAPSAAPANATP